MSNTTPNGPQPIRDGRGGTIIGPANPAREGQAIDRFVPPSTDHGSVPSLRWSFADSHNRLDKGGWSRQTTGRELPIAQKLNCVNMRLNAGGIRELHWHEPDEWGYVTKGRVRVTAVDGNGCAFQDDIGEGDIWNFPGGIPHSIQALDPDGSEFLLVFNDGNFNENATFLLSDWLAHVPRSVLAKNFGVPESAFDGIPASELYMFQAQVPGPLDADRVVGAGPVPQSYSYRMSLQTPIETRSGSVRIVDASSFPAAQMISAALVEVQPGGMRELHWHPLSDEMQYYLEGEGRMTVYTSGSNAGTFNYEAGDVGYVSKSQPHYIENTGSTTLRFLELWASPLFSDVSLAQWLAYTPYELVRAHLNIDRSVVERVTTAKTPVVGS